MKCLYIDFLIVITEIQTSYGTIRKKIIYAKPAKLPTSHWIGKNSQADEYVKPPHSVVKTIKWATPLPF
jgi:hypothetical protein